jgi:alpha-L-fucosidase
VRRIQFIRVWNRSDCCTERLRAFHVITSSESLPDGSLAAVRRGAGVRSVFVPGVAGRPTTVPIDTEARYVRVQLAEPGLLTLHEVEVWGWLETRGRREE